MNIRELIKDLLLKHNTVVLPGIGGFTTEYEEAKIDTKENKLVPPKKNVKFDPNLIKDENVLIENYLIKTFKISKNEASEKTDQFIEELKKELSAGATVEITNIGYLKTNDKKEIIFDPKVDKNLLLDSLGFEPFTQQPVNKPVIKSKPKIVEKNIKKQKDWLILKPSIAFPTAAILVILVLILFTDVEKIILNINVKKLFAGKEKNKIETIDTTAQSALEKSLDEQTNPSIALKINKGEVAPSNNKYANCTEFIIIAGSFTQFRNAEELRQQLTQKGYNPKIILSDEKRYRVALKSFDNRQVALREFEALKEKEKGLNVWLLSI